MAKSHIDTQGINYEVLSDDAVDKLHQNFQEKIKGKADKLVPQDTAARSNVVDQVSDSLFLYERLAENAPIPTMIDAITKGKKALNRHASTLKEQLEIDPWKKYRGRLNGQFSRREESLLTSKTFGDKERIYLKLKNDVEVSDIQLAVQMDLVKQGYKITDYLKGYATDEAGKQQFKIGKLLKANGELLEKYTNDETRTNQSKYIVISRNQTDIENMTARRSWFSCMAPNMFGHYVPPIVGSKTLIAYLVSENDPEINNPLSRILLKPYDCRKQVKGIRKEDSLWQDFKRAVMPERYKEEELSEDSVVFMLGISYGLGTSAFTNAVQEFTDAHLNKPNNQEYRLYNFIYADGSPSKVELRNGQLANSMWPRA